MVREDRGEDGIVTKIRHLRWEERSHASIKA